MDLFVVPTISFRRLYGLLILQHSRRELVWLGVTTRPSVYFATVVCPTSMPSLSSSPWTLAYGYQEDRTPLHGYAPTREDAMAAFAKSWRRV
jgi:hypothetical protein